MATSRLVRALEHSRCFAGVPDYLLSNHRAGASAAGVPLAQMLGGGQFGGDSAPVGPTNPEHQQQHEHEHVQPRQQCGVPGLQGAKRTDFTPRLQKWYDQALGRAAQGVWPTSEELLGGPHPDTAPSQDLGHSAMFSPLQGGGAYPVWPQVYPGSTSGPHGGTSAALQLLDDLSKSTGSLTLNPTTTSQNQLETQDFFEHQQQQQPLARPWIIQSSVGGYESPLGSALMPSTQLDDHMYASLGRCNWDGHDGVSEPALHSQKENGSDTTEEPGQAEETIFFDHSGEPISEKKMRRLLSNRASAKRSRKRRQDRLQELEIMSAKLRVEHAGVQHELAAAHAQLKGCEEENEALRRDVEELRARCQLRRQGSSFGASTQAMGTSAGTPTPSCTETDTALPLEPSDPATGQPVVCPEADETAAPSPKRARGADGLPRAGAALALDADEQDFLCYMGCDRA